MAVPTIRGVGAIAADVGAISPGLPAGTAVGDGLIMLCETFAAQAITATGWTVEFELDSGGTTRITILSRIATGTDPTTTNDSGNHNMGRIIGIEAGTFDATDWLHVVGVGNTQTSTVSVSITGITTTVNDCLILACSVGDLPDATGTAEFSSPANASLANVAEQIDNTTAAGNGGAILMISGDLATAGASGTTTATAANAAVRANVTLAISPVSAGVTGTAAVTLADSTSDGSGTVANPVTGTASPILADATSAATGVETMTGTASPTLGDATSTASGTVANPVTGSAAVTLEDFVGEGSGEGIIAGSAAVTLADFTSTATGTETISGTSAPTLADATSTASGVVANPISGTAAVTLQDFTSTGSGTVTIQVTGSAAVTLEDFTPAATGSETYTGTAAITLQDFTSDGAGTVATDATGTVAVTLAAFTSSASGSVTGLAIPLPASATIGDDDNSGTITNRSRVAVLTAADRRGTISP